MVKKDIMIKRYQEDLIKKGKMKMLKDDQEQLLKTFYGNMVNKEFYVMPLEWNQYPEYKNHYPMLKPTNSIDSLIKRMNHAERKYKQIMNIYISAYDFDKEHDIFEYHMKNGNYKETRYGLVLKPSDERTIYPYSKHVFLDRIFHDFDAELSFDDKQFMKNPEIAIDEKREHMKNILFEKHIAEKPLQEALMLGNFYQEKMGLKPTYVFSGKGIHLYIHFKPIKLEFTNYVLSNLSKAIMDTFHFKTFDENVFESARKSRILTSQNPKTSYYVKPINPHWEYFEILDDVESPSINVDVQLDHEVDSIHKVLIAHDKIAKQKEKENKLNKRMTITKRPKIFANKNQTVIARPEDAVHLLQYPCFNHMKFSDYNNLVLVNLWSWTDLKDANDVQDAMLMFWQHKGIKDMQKNEHGFKRVQKNYKKYIFTENSMKKMDLCRFCDNWKSCFRYQIRFNHDYYDKLNEHKNQ